MLDFSSFRPFELFEKGIFLFFSKTKTAGLKFLSPFLGVSLTELDLRPQKLEDPTNLEGGARQFFVNFKAEKVDFAGFIFFHFFALIKFF